MFKSKYFFATFAVIALLTVISVNVAFAVAGPYTELAPLPGTGTNCTGGNDANCTVDVTTTGGLGTYINNLYKLAVAGASVLAVLMIIIGGFNYVSTDAINNKEEGKSTIKSALGGLLLVLASWVILNTVNPKLLDLKIATKALTSTPLEDLFQFGRAASDSYNKETDRLIANLNANRNAARDLEATAVPLQSLLDGINAIGQEPLSQEQQDQLNGYCTQAGLTPPCGTEGLQRVIDGINGRAQEIRQTTTAMTTAEETVNNASGQNITDPTRINPMAFNLNQNYIQRAGAINSNSLFTAEQRTTMTNQMRTTFNNSITTLCNRIPLPIIGGGGYGTSVSVVYATRGSSNDNPAYNSCMANIIPST